MAHRAPKTVEFPNHQRVAAAQIGERLGQAGPIGFCTRCVIVAYPVAPGRVQRVDDWKSVASGKSVSVRVDLGGTRIINKTNIHNLTIKTNYRSNTQLNE